MNKMVGQQQKALKKRGNREFHPLGMSRGEPLLYGIFDESDFKK